MLLSILLVICQPYPVLLLLLSVYHMDISLLFGREGGGMHLETKHPSELQQLFILNAAREHIGGILFHLAKSYWPHFPFKLFMHVFHARLHVVHGFRVLAAFSFRSSRSLKDFFSLFWRCFNLIMYWNTLHYKINWSCFFLLICTHFKNIVWL